MRDFIVENLQDHYRVVTATDGEKALALLSKKEVSPHLILSVVMMPQMDGFTLLQKIRSHAEWHILPMILLTARSAQEDKIQALTIGVDDYLTKPFDTAELLARIRDLLTNYRERARWQKEQPPKATLDIQFGEQPESWDTQWLRQAEDIVKRELVNHEYKVSDLAAELNISESQLLTKMKQITGLTPTNLSGR